MFNFSNVLYAALHYVLESWQAGVADIYIKVTFIIINHKSFLESREWLQ